MQTITSDSTIVVLWHSDGVTEENGNAVDIFLAYVLSLNMIVVTVLEDRSQALLFEHFQTAC
jgi:hypothetical protein